MDKKSCGKVENKMFGSKTNLKKKKNNDQNNRIVGGQEVPVRSVNKSTEA